MKSCQWCNKYNCDKKECSDSEELRSRYEKAEDEMKHEHATIGKCSICEKENKMEHHKKDNS